MICRIVIVTLIAFVCQTHNFICATELHRSPAAVALSSDRQFCLTENKTAGTVSLIRLSDATIVTELKVGLDPVDVSWVDTNTALVALQADDAIAVVRREDDTCTLLTTLPVGDEPNGISVSPDHRRVFVALGGEDSVAVMDMAAVLSTTATKSDVITHRIPVGGIPRQVVVSPDGKWLVTCCAVPCEMFVHDADTLEPISARKIFDGGFNPCRPAITADSQLVLLPSAINREFSVTARMIDIGWVIDNRISKLPLPDGEPGDQKQLGLDVRGHAVGDANSVAISPDGKQLVVSCGGTHELLVLDYPSIPWPSGDPGDFLPEALKKDTGRFRRIKLAGRPTDVRFISDNQVVVANFLSDSLQFVDLAKSEVTNTVELGGPAKPDLVRRGEAIFYDADRSMHSWFSCHTCHPDGHTAGQTFDTHNDKSYGTQKLIPSLRGVAQTAPWTWHGWQTDLHDAMRRSMQESMNTEKPFTDDEVDALTAYVSTLNHPVNPRSTSDSPDIQSGKRLFEGRAGCIQCHSGEMLTAAKTFDGAVNDSKDSNKLYNPPSLRGVSSRRRFLHTGKARDLKNVISRYHRPEDLVGESLTDAEVSSLVEYLKTL